MQDFFNRFTGERGRKDIFRGWPAVQLVQSIPEDEPRQFREFKRSTAAEINPQKYGKALVIGLGATGRLVVQEWLRQVGQDPAGTQESLRAILLSQAPFAPLRDSPVALQEFDFTEGSHTPTSLRQWRSQRELVYLLFRQAANYRPFEEYLNTCLSELKQDMYVYVVASATEYDTGMLGPVLQAIRLAGAARIGSIPNGVIALLTLGAVRPAQSEAEIYATLREIGRFSFAGTQWMEAPAGLPGGAVHGALLDHTLLVEVRGGPQSGTDLSRVPFEDGLGKVMGEALFSLTHPSGHPMLEQLTNSQAAELRSKSHRAMVHSLGIATLQVPLAELQANAAVRLARAVIYSENEDRGWEGLAFRPKEPLVDTEAAESQARDWLRSGPCEHPFFVWLMAAEDENYFRTVPDVAPEFKIAFKAQVANGLVRLLNDPTLIDRLGLARRSLGWLEQRIINLQELFRQASTQAAADPGRHWFRDFLEDAYKTLQHLQGEVTAWERVLYEAADNRSGFLTTGERPAASLNGSWWQSLSGKGEQGTVEGDAPASGDAELEGKNLAELFDRYQARTGEQLERSASGLVRRSVLSGNGGELKEAQAYYRNSMRPELSRGIQERGRAFERVRERLGWWVRLEDAPQLFMVCAPPGFSRQDERAPYPNEMLWKPEQFSKLGAQIIELCRMQARGLADELGGTWLSRQFVDAAGFLSRANDPLLRFDQQKAAVNFFRTMRKSYLIAQSKTITGSCREIVFPGISAAEVDELADGEPDRMTAITFEYNVPLNTILTLNQYYASYGHQESFHIYPQEQNATRYERRMRAFQSREELPAELTMLLVDQQRVSLFFQAVFCGLVGIFPDELGHRQDWSIVPLLENEQYFPLAPDSQTGMLDAMRAFVLEMPYAAGLERQYGSPFHPTRYEKFIQRIWKETRLCRSSDDFMSIRLRFEQEHLRHWRERGERDLLAKAFANLLQVELEDPLWRDW